MWGYEWIRLSVSTFPTSPHLLLFMSPSRHLKRTSCRQTSKGLSSSSESSCRNATELQRTLAGSWSRPATSRWGRTQTYVCYPCVLWSSLLTLLFVYKNMVIHNVPWYCIYSNKESLLWQLLPGLLDLISRGVRRAQVEFCLVWFSLGCIFGLSVNNYYYNYYYLIIIIIVFI